MASRLSQAASRIFRELDGLDHPVLRQGDLRRLLNLNRSKWHLPDGLRWTQFVEFLTEKGRLRQIVLEFPYRPETLYVWGDVGPLVIAASAKPKAYLCHQTAMTLHKLGPSATRLLYVNCEQKGDGRWNDDLQQTAIDAAFRRPQRLTKYRAKLDRHQLVVLNGKQTGDLGVITMKDEDGWSMRVTGIERTLIDISVRPAYAGGPKQILRAFRAARGRFSTTTLSEMLEQMDFAYPYHQAIGFYLERGGYDEADLTPFRSRPQTHDFYLDYAIKDPAYSESWRLHVPATM